MFKSEQLSCLHRAISSRIEGDRRGFANLVMEVGREEEEHVLRAIFQIFEFLIIFNIFSKIINFYNQI